LALEVGGVHLHDAIVLNAFLVLSGAVLTSYVGITGLVHRMTLDQCFPQFFLKTNRRGTYHRITLSFMLLCISILYLTGGNLLSLAGVYTISFLGVMTLFGIGNILLKVNRKELKRRHSGGPGHHFGSYRQYHHRLPVSPVFYGVLYSGSAPGEPDV